VLASTFISPRSTDPPARRPSDLSALLAFLVLLAVTAARTDIPSELELQLAIFLNRFPEGLSGALTAILGLGALWLVVLVAGLGFLTRRRRLSLELALTGAATWVIGRIVVSALGRRVAPSGIRLRAGGLQQFPSVRVAIVIAVVAAAAPYLTRGARSLGWLFVATASLAAAARGTGLPNDIIGGLALGGAAAALVHLIFGSPAGRPSLEQIGDALDELGIATTHLEFASEPGAASTCVVARDREGRALFIRAYGRDQRDAQLLSKLWRFVWYEDSGPTLYLTRLQQVEHEAYAMLLARQAGVPVPEVLAAATAGPGTAVIVEGQPEGVPLADDTIELTDALLDEVWAAAVALRRARIAHGALDMSTLSAGVDDKIIVTDFTRATTPANDAQLNADAARLLAATAASVGARRAVAAAHDALGGDTLVEVLAYVQSPVLTDHTRHALRQRGVSLSELRAAAGTAAHKPVPAPARLERAKPRRIAMAGITFVGVYLLFGQLGNYTAVSTQIRTAEWEWIIVAVAFVAATNIGYALAYVGSTTAHLPFGRTVLLQAAGSFTNVVTPNAVGTAGINTRFLQVRGVRLASAIGSQVVNTVGSGVVQLLMFATILPVAAQNFDLGRVPWRSLLTLVVALGAAAAVVAAIAWQVPQARRFVRDHVRPAVVEVHTVVRSPAKVALVLGGNLSTQLLTALSLGAVCRAFGASLPYSTLVIVSIGSSAISGLVPAPGGLGVAEATLAGALTAAGLPSALAVTATLTQRLVTTWLPTIPGWFALRALERGDDL
jgi:uncharacterized membrane protein YbhN (UPF0104 family)